MPGWQKAGGEDRCTTSKPRLTRRYWENRTTIQYSLWFPTSWVSCNTGEGALRHSTEINESTLHLDLEVPRRSRHDVMHACTSSTDCIQFMAEWPRPHHLCRRRQRERCLSLSTRCCCITDAPNRFSIITEESIQSRHPHSRHAPSYLAES